MILFALKVCSADISRSQGVVWSGEACWSLQVVRTVNIRKCAGDWRLSVLVTLTAALQQGCRTSLECNFAFLIVLVPFDLTFFFCLIFPRGSRDLGADQRKRYEIKGNHTQQLYDTGWHWHRALPA